MGVPSISFRRKETADREIYESLKRSPEKSVSPSILRTYCKTFRWTLRADGSLAHEKRIFLRPDSRLSTKEAELARRLAVRDRILKA